MIYTNLHRLASEAMISAIQAQDESSLDSAENYAKQALTVAKNYFEVVLSQGFLNTVAMMRIAFQAQREGKI